MIKNFKLFVESLKDELSIKLDNKYKEVKEELIDLIEKSLKTSDEETFDSFIDSFIKNSEETQIEGLINDSDIYDFYLKYRNDIDEVLSEIKFYDEVPSEINSYGLYDYLIKGTKESIKQLVKDIKEETSK